MTDNDIIQEATEATEKNLNAGCYVGDLLRIIKEKNAEIERLNAVSEICGECHKKYAEKIEQAKFEAYREFAERLCKDRVSNDPVVIAVKVELEELTESNE